MVRQLPPLNALRAFEAAARHLSFTKAADELHVTQAAVSHQVKTLEEYLGVQLFQRRNKAVLLTEAGQLCLPGLREGFDRLAAAIATVRAKGAENLLSVTVTPSVAAKWLVPRLDRFRAVQPTIDVRIDASTALVDLARESFDLGIRYGAGHYPGLRTDLLLDEDISPVCSPRLLDGPQPLKSPADLRAHTLLHTEWSARGDAWPDWRMWLLAAGAPDVDWTRGTQFNDPTLAIQAAIEGQGVALGRSALVQHDLARGRLVRPFDLSVPGKFSYYVVSTRAAAERPKVSAFRDWLLAEARGSAAAG